MKKIKMLLPVLATTGAIGTMCATLVSCKEEASICFATNEWASIIGSNKIKIKNGQKWSEIQDQLPEITPVGTGSQLCTLDGWYNQNNDKMKDDDILHKGMVITAVYKTPYDDTNKFYNFDTNINQWVEYKNLATISETAIEKITLPSNEYTETISRDQFNERFYIGSGITAIDSWFLKHCTKFNQPITLPNTVKSIGNSFMLQCESFNQQLSLPSGLSKINSGFLSQCHTFNKKITLPNGLESIGHSFLNECSSFNQPIILPKTITSVDAIEEQFLYRCNKMTSIIDIQNLKVNCFKQSDYTLATDDKTAPMYKKGIKIVGDNVDAFLNKFPKEEEGPQFRYLHK